jgi:membrane protein
MFTDITSTSLSTTLRPWQRAIVVAFKRSLKANTMQLASSLAFSTVFAIVPLLAVSLSIFAALPEFEAFSLALQEYLANNLLPSHVSSNIMEYLNVFAAKASHLSAVGGIFLVGTIIALVHQRETPCCPPLAGLYLDYCCRPGSAECLALDNRVFGP